MDWADGGGGEKMDEDKETDVGYTVKSGLTARHDPRINRVLDSTVNSWITTRKKRLNYKRKQRWMQLIKENYRWLHPICLFFGSLVKNCNHKGLGIYYLLSAFIFGISGTLISVLIRIELYYKFIIDIQIQVMKSFYL